MSPITKKIIFYILMSFFVIGFLVVVFFGYKILFSDKSVTLPKINLSILDELIEKQEEIEKGKENGFLEESSKPCIFRGQEVQSGKRAFFYLRPSVSAFESCDSVKQARACNDGQWFGDPRYKFTTCERTIDCKIDDETIVKNTEAIELFSRKTVSYGDDCNHYKKKRVCRESVLTGSPDYKFKTCVVDTENTCQIAGLTLANGQSRTFFLKSEVPFGESCGDNNMMKRTCEFGVMNGDQNFTELFCKVHDPANCVLDGVEVEHGGGRVFYSKRHAENGHDCNFFAYFGKNGEGRVCNNGILSGMEEYKYSFCVD